jgi:TPP-dependent trihydroxycyclohexane-1,2-dione (THcHDO) dehydratase
LRADELALNEIMGLIEKAERPVLYCGGGIITSGAAAELKKFKPNPCRDRCPLLSLMGRECGDFIR